MQDAVAANRAWQRLERTRDAALRASRASCDRVGTLEQSGVTLACDCNRSESGLHSDDANHAAVHDAMQDAGAEDTAARI